MPGRWRQGQRALPSAQHPVTRRGETAVELSGRQTNLVSRRMRDVQRVCARDVDAGPAGT
jgi:hypothetical protein